MKPVLVIITRSWIALYLPLEVLQGHDEVRVVVWSVDAPLASLSSRLEGEPSIALDEVSGKPGDTCKTLREAGYSLLHALVCGVAREALEAIRAAIPGESTPALRVWSILEWLEENTVHDASVDHVETPLEFLSTRRGKCIDYAVFTAAALLAEGFRSVYLIGMYDERLPGGGHVVAAVELNGTIVVLDQRLPLVELQDYYQWMLGFKPTCVTVYRVWFRDGEARLASGTTITLKLVDVYLL